MADYLKNNLVPAILWGSLHIFLLHGNLSILGGLFALRGLLVFIFLLVRYEPIKRAPLYQIIIAWGSTWLSTQLTWVFAGGLSSDVGIFLLIGGAVIAGVSIIDLGRSFGISPAIRPKVDSGIYRYVSNPMYWGHVVGELGILILSPTLRNMGLIILGWSLYYIRARWERNLVLENFPAVLEVPTTSMGKISAVAQQVAR